jgi:hypothetical protein
MRFRLSTWRPAHLLTAWCAYWLALALWMLGPMLPSLWRITRPDAHGTFNASAGDGVIRVVLTSDGATVWTGQIGVAALALLATIPPLILWAFWLRAQRRPAPARAEPTARPAHRMD